MSIYIVKDNEKKKINISATDVQLLDIDGKFKNKNLEDAMKEVGSGTEANMLRIEEKVNGLETNVTQLSNPNLLVNGDFQVWGNLPTVTHSTGNIVYVDNKWAVYKGSVTKVGEEVKLTQTTLNVNTTFRQYIENFNHLKGKTVTLSTNITQLKNCCNIYINAVRSEDGTAEVLAIGNRITTPGKYSLTVTMSNDLSKYKEMYVSIQSYNLASLNQTEVGFTQFEYMKLEIGNKATPLSPKLQHEEILACNNGIIGSNPNLLINGDFQVWQRGTSFNISSNGTYNYTADRWVVQTNSTGVTALKLGDGCLRVVNSNFNGTYLNISQFIESTFYQKIVGKDVTITVKFKNSVSNIRLGLRAFPDATAISKTFTTDKIVFNTTIPTCSTTCTKFMIYLQSVQTQTIDIEYIKMELGTVSTPMVNRTYGEELALCQRYYIDNNFYKGWGMMYVSNATYCEVYIPTPVTMRTNPTAIPHTSGSMQYYSDKGWVDAPVTTWYLGYGCIRGAGKITDVAHSNRLLNYIPSFDAEIY